MDEVTDYLRKARGVAQATFQQMHPHHFLYKHPKEAVADRPSEPDIDYATRAMDLNFDPMPTITQLVQGDKLTLRDNKAANGTFHNRRRLEPGSSRSIRLGDTLGFGALELELIDAGRLYQLLRAGSPLAQGASQLR